MLKIVLYCNDLTGFEAQKAAVSAAGLAGHVFIFGNSNVNSREQLINENQNSWLLFLDHDCLPGGAAISEIKRIIAKQSEKRQPVVYAGLYLNPEGATHLQRTHNKIANTWLEQSYTGAKTAPVLLGGIFLIFSEKSVKLPLQKFWGAEDKLLARHLISAGYELQLERGLTAVHHTNKSFRHFVKRAVLHGRHDAMFFGGESDSNVFYWIQRTDFSDLRLMPLVLLHFCIQRGAKAAQKVLRQNR